MPIAEPIDGAAVLGALSRIRPFLQLDGGDVRLAAIGDGEVQLDLLGSCRRCPNMMMTFRYGVVPELRAILPRGTRIRANGQMNLLLEIP